MYIYIYYIYIYILYIYRIKFRGRMRFSPPFAPRHFCLHSTEPYSLIYSHKLQMCVSSYQYQYIYTHTHTYVYMCPHPTIHVFYMCMYIYVCVCVCVYISNYSISSVLILLQMCPHNTLDVSSYCYRCVLILLQMCPHTVSSYCYRCVLILCHIQRPHTTTYLILRYSVPILLYYLYIPHTTLVDIDTSITTTQLDIAQYEVCSGNRCVSTTTSVVCQRYKHIYYHYIPPTTLAVVERSMRHVVVIDVSSYSAISSVRIRLHTSYYAIASAYSSITSTHHTTLDVSSYCVLILLQMCPHTPPYLASPYSSITTTYLILRQQI